MKTVKPGNWHDASVWDAGRVPTENDEVVVDHDVWTDKKSIVIKNRYTSRNAFLEFRNIVETEFIGSIDDPKDPNFGKADAFGVVMSDVGLYAVGDGVLDIQGQVKNRWTNATQSVQAGALSIPVKDASGWNIGDIICIVPTRKPTVTPDWDDAANAPVDPFTREFERRMITGKRGNILDFAERLQFDHNTVVTDEGKIWFPEVGNLTSGVGVRGTKGRRAHIFIKSSKPQTILNAELSYLGPRRGGRRPDLWLGRYAVHFHHCGEGSRGTRIESNAIHDLGSRAIVPHGSNGMNVEKNFVLGFMNDGLWWDPGHRTHDHVYKENLVACVIYNGVASGNTSGIQYGQGDNNRAEGNVCVYTKMGDDAHIGGGHVWNANDEGVWIMIRNLVHSNQTGFFVWQNTPNDHTIDQLEAYNCEIAGMQGAYGNSYSFYKCYFYNAPLNLKATPGNDAPMFMDCVFDGGGKVAHVVEMQGSAIPAGHGNGFINCTFKNYTDAAFLMNTYDGHGSIGRKGVDLVLCKFSGRVYKFSAQSIFESWVREQPINGTPYRADQKGVVQIPPFAPTYWGTGLGLTGEYFNGSNFESKAFTRIDQNIKFQQWTIDPGSSPDGPHHLIKNDSFSVRWTGFVEPQVSGNYQFVIESFGGVRAFIEVGGQEVKVLDRWVENNDRVAMVTSSVNLNAKTKYKVKFEHMNQGGDRGFMLSWQTPGLGGIRLIPRSQLYPAGTTPAPVTYYSREFSGPFTRNNCPGGNIAGQITFKVVAGKYTSQVSQADADGKAEADFKTNGQALANSTGTCTPPETVKYKNTEQKRSFQKNNCAAGDVGDTVEYKVPAGTYTSAVSQADAEALALADIERNGQSYANAKGMCTSPGVGLQANAGADISASGTQVTLDGSKSTGKWRAINWYMDNGPKSWNLVSQNEITTVANRLVDGVYYFRLKLTGLDGKISEDSVMVKIGKEVDPEPVPRAIVGWVVELPDGKLEATEKAVKRLTVHFNDSTTQEVKP
jgi:hypothetical protein